MSETCTCAEDHARHVYDGGPCNVRCLACCLASWDDDERQKAGQ